MRLKTPHFWYRPFGFKALVLLLPSLIYGAGYFLRKNLIRPYHANAKVLCVGNLTAGGSGKTPTALAVSKLVKDELISDNPCFLSRGYGRDKSTEKYDHFLVNPDSHTATHAGDEALLLAERLNTIIASNRAHGAKYAEELNHDLIIMDDGMQNPQLQKDLILTVIDGGTAFGNGQLIPAGPLREPLSCGLKRSDAFVIMGETNENVLAKLPKNKPVFNAKLTVPDSWIANKEVPYIAFCGLGHPDKFKRTLNEKGLNIVNFHPYPDHYQYSESQLQELKAEAQKHKGRLITTSKDAARIPKELTKNIPLDILPIEVTWQDKDAIITFLKEKLSA